MARPPSGVNLNIAQLQRVLNEKRSELQKLHRRRNELQRKMAHIDRRIERIGGGIAMNGGRRGGGIRARNERSLLDTLESVMREAGRPMKVGEILDAVLASGYRSSSDNFRGIINQTLIKDKRFGQVERGVYELKSGGKRDRKSAA